MLEAMRQVLIQRRDAIVRAMSGDDSLLENFSQNSGGDVVDFASDSAMGELSSQLAEVENRELQHLEVALKKMKLGTFGKCDVCQSNIPLPRLQALPYTAYCITCKRAAEKAGVQPGAEVDWSVILNQDISSDSVEFNFS